MWYIWVNNPLLDNPSAAITNHTRRLDAPLAARRSPLSPLITSIIPLHMEYPLNMANSKTARLRTPKGTASYPWLTKPDRKFPNAAGLGHYKVDLIFDDPNEPELVALVAKLDTILADALAEVKATGKWWGETISPRLISKLVLKSPLQLEEDKDSYEPTGRVFLRFKQTEKIPAEKGGPPTRDMKPALVDARGHRIVGDIFVRGGSTLKVAFQAAPYCNASQGVVGLTLRPSAVQILALAEGEDGDGFGFEPEEDGYEYVPQEPTAAAASTEGTYEATGEEDVGYQAPEGQATGPAGSDF
jgi:hypothetical protein